MFFVNDVDVLAQRQDWKFSTSHIAPPGKTRCNNYSLFQEKINNIVKCRFEFFSIICQRATKKIKKYNEIVVNTFYVMCSVYANLGQPYYI